MRTQTIQFTFKKKTYTFSRSVTAPATGTLEFIYECYKKVGAKPSQVSNRIMTHSNWNFWCGYTP